MARTGIVTQDLSPETYHWLTKAIPKGTVVHRFYGQTFGAVSDDGIACTLEPDKHPFFEVPKQLIEWKD